MSEWVDESAHPPAVLLVDRRVALSTSGDGVSEHRVGILNQEKHSARSVADVSRDQALGARPGSRDPEHRVADGELGDDVISLAGAVQHPGAERGLVEGQRRRTAVDSQFGLNGCHSRPSAACAAFIARASRPKVHAASGLLTEIEAHRSRCRFGKGHLLHGEVDQPVFGHAHMRMC
jgi:hypothetical protein